MQASPIPPDTASRLRALLLDWYDGAARTLPWRIGPERTKAGIAQTPYRVWLSEIMLQQTTVAAVAPRFEAFLKAAPSVDALAQMPVEQVLGLWAGLGYYARARNLHACATVVAARGGFPDTLEGLRALPGVGEYTARAIGAIAFGLPLTPVDGNVERVLSRLLRVETPLPRAKPVFQALASSFDGAERPGDFAQALMDLGATVCTPKNPACGRCPWAGQCGGFQAGDAAAFPKKAPKAARPNRAGAVVLVTDGQHALVRRRPERGLLGGMLELPGTDWAVVARPGPAVAPPMDRAVLCGRVKHVFTHFTLHLDVWRLDVANVDEVAPDGGFVMRLDELAAGGLPTLMAKALKIARHGQGSLLV
jgi:A/G-specific adenine glycosylase